VGQTAGDRGGAAEAVGGRAWCAGACYRRAEGGRGTGCRTGGETEPGGVVAGDCADCGSDCGAAAGDAADDDAAVGGAEVAMGRACGAGSGGDRWEARAG